MRSTPRQLLAPALGAGALVLLALLTTGGDVTQPPNQLPTTWVDVVLIIAGAIAAGALVIGRQGGSGGLTFWLFAAVAALTALSIDWSVAPDQSWEESGRTLAYLAVFGVGIVLARRGSGSSANAVLGITLGALGLCVWALAVKTLNLDLYGQRAFGRLLSPTGYWNTTGVSGALALPGLIWLAARRTGVPLIRGLACAGITIAATVVALSYSRTAVAAGVFGTVLPLFWIPSRRRAVVMLVLGLVGAIPVCVYALADHGVSGDGAMVHRGGAGLLLGIIILAVAALLTGLATRLTAWIDAHPPAPVRVARFDRGLIGLVCLVPVVIVAWLLFNGRGPVGEVTHIWDTLTSTHAAVGNTASRLTDAANSRPAYYRQAFEIGAHHLLAGSGAGTFYPALLHYPAALLTADPAHHAHSYVMETFATLGLLGVAINLALFLAWCRDARRSTRRRLQVTATASELDARWALIGVVIAFGVSSALDYTWFFPAVAVPALFGAGWIAGIGAVTPADAFPAGQPGSSAPPVRAISTRPGAIVALTLIAVLGLLAAWESLQPMRSVQSANASLSAQPTNPGVALSDARAAVSEDPLSAAALLRLASVYSSLRELPLVRATYEKAVRVQPDNPQAVAALGGYQVCVADYKAAARTLKRAMTLDITNSDFQSNLYNAAIIDSTASWYCHGLS